MINLNILLQYILAILGFSLIILVHESGHFSLAKISGMHVEEFFLGLGPKILKLKSKSGTTYGISAIPLGGYNKILGMDRNEHIPDDKKDKAFYSKPFYKKLMVIIGGVGFNAIFAVILIGIFLSMGVLIPVNIIDYVQPGSPADIYGFKAGDRVIALNDVRIEGWEDFSSITKSNPGEKVTYTVIRDDKEMDIETILADVEGEGFLGIMPKLLEKRLGFFEIVSESFKMTWDIIKAYFRLFGMLVTGRLSFGEARPVSPVGVISIFQQSAAMGIQNFILFIALVSLLLVFGNLIPILPLDGGFLIILIIEAIRRKPVPRRFLEAYNTFGIVIIISLLIVGFVFDIISPFSLTNM